MRRLFCHYVYLISPSFGASGGLWFMSAAFSGYLYILYGNHISILIVAFVENLHFDFKYTLKNKITFNTH